jgi:DNA-binding transcriptional MocR family regulator
MAIEDAVYAFLAGDMPFAASAPTHTIVIESLSKRLAPGITLGMLCVPPIMKERVASELRTGGWAAHGFPLAAAIGWILDGTAERVVEAKQNDAKARQV